MAGSFTTVVLDVNGAAHEWGDWKYGGRPVPPADLGPVVTITTRHSHICGLTPAGEVRCWGYPLYGTSTVPGPATSCSRSGENASVAIGCPPGQAVTSIVYANYGATTGTCGGDDLAMGECQTAASRGLVEGTCIGRSFCVVPSSNFVFGGDPCNGTAKQLVVSAHCE
jgi:hypothetical protein